MSYLYKITNHKKKHKLENINIIVININNVWATYIVAHIKSN